MWMLLPRHYSYNKTMPTSDFQFSQPVETAPTGQQTIFVRSVSPRALITGQSKEVSMSGAGFIAPVTVMVGGKTIPASFTTATLVKFVMPYIPAGTYDIVVVNGSGNHWVSRHIMVITNPTGTSFDLGSAGKPIVLPAVMVEASPTAQINRAAAYRKANSAATVSTNQTTNQMTAFMPWDSSGIATEPVKVPIVQSNPSQGNVLNTPWGDFTNE